MLAEDAAQWFESHGGLTRENGQRFREMVLSRGNTLDLAEMYRNFTGHDPDIQPYLEYYGLTGASAPPAAAPGAVPPPAAAPAESPKPGERGL
jgi:peptidyl-dipeptidase Dcp